MKIACSAGHVYDLASFLGNWNSYGMREGDPCPAELAYDRMTGLRRCRRVLKLVREDGTILHRGKPLKVVKS